MSTRRNGHKAGLRAVVAVGLVGLALAGCSGPSRSTRADLAAQGVTPAGRLASTEGADRLALSGYDPVSYFEPGGPAKGDPARELVLDGSRYRFASDEHRQRFEQAPDRYRPAYGGWCATAMADGRFVESDPTNFRVRDGRLFVFYRFAFIDATGSWDANPAGLTADADQRWTALVDAERATR